MRLDDGEKEFLINRMRFVRLWQYIGPVLICSIAFLGGWLYIRHPLLANPKYVLAKLQQGHIDRKTLELMATILPFITWLLIFLCLVVVLFIYAALSNERKYLAILTREAQDPAKTASGSIQVRHNNRPD